MDTLTNPSGLGTKVLGRRRVWLLLLLLGSEVQDAQQGLEPTTSTGKQFVSLETVAITTPWTTVFLVVIIVVLLIVIVVLLKIMHVMHIRPEAARDAMDWARTQCKQNRVRRLIRDVEQAQFGVYLEDASSEHGHEAEF